VDFAVAGLERVPDAFLKSLLGATAAAARERGVTVRISDDTLLLGEVVEAEDVAAILGNLVGNAVTAAVAGAEPGWVEIALLGDRDELVVTVSDSGGGIRPLGADPFARVGSREPEAGEQSAVHGHGFGLPLSRDLARRHGGDVWLIDAGGDGSGAVFGARLPGALRGAGPAAEEENA
jgi:two-component system CitB family sensor kinase